MGRTKGSKNKQPSENKPPSDSKKTSDSRQSSKNKIVNSDRSSTNSDRSSTNSDKNIIQPKITPIIQSDKPSNTSDLNSKIPHKEKKIGYKKQPDTDTNITITDTITDTNIVIPNTNHTSLDTKAKAKRILSETQNPQTQDSQNQAKSSQPQTIPSSPKLSQEELDALNAKTKAKEDKMVHCDKCHKSIPSSPNRIDTNLISGRVDYHRSSPRYILLCDTCGDKLSDIVDNWLFDNGSGVSPKPYSPFGIELIKREENEEETKEK